MQNVCELSSAQQPTADSTLATSFRDICLLHGGVLWVAELCRWASSFDVWKYRIAFLEDEGNMMLRNVYNLYIYIYTYTTFFLTYLLHAEKSFLRS
jgi:hypothetical protein